MSIIFSAFIPTLPKAKARPRFRKKGQPYTPKNTADAELLIKLAVARQWRQKPVEGAVSLILRVYLPRPKSAKKRKLPTVKPDWDNFGKLVSDSLNGLVWKDDKQIVSAFVNKQYCDSEQPEPGYQVTIVSEEG